MRARILIFLVVLTLDAMFLRKQPWPVVVGCATYLLVVFPALKRREPLGSRSKPTPTQGGRMETQPEAPYDPEAPVQPEPPAEPPAEPDTGADEEPAGEPEPESSPEPEDAPVE